MVPNPDFAGVSVYEAGVAADAFHGTSVANAKRIVSSRTFEIRSLANDELGPAVYFCLGDPEAALAYARAAQYLAGRHAVVRATAKLGATLNAWLLEPLVDKFRQSDKLRNLDWRRAYLLLIRMCRQYFESHGRPVHCIRYFRRFHDVQRHVLVLAVYDPSSVEEMAIWQAEEGSD